MCCNSVQKESSMTWGIFHHLKHLEWQSSKKNSFLLPWPDLKVRIYLVLWRLSVLTSAAKSKKLPSCMIKPNLKNWLLAFLMMKLKLGNFDVFFLCPGNSFHEAEVETVPKLLSSPLHFWVQGRGHTQNKSSKILHFPEMVSKKLQGLRRANQRPPMRHL